MIQIDFNPDDFLIPGKALFVATDFKNAAGLVQRLQISADAVSQYLMSQFSAQTSQDIQQFDGSQASLDSLTIKLTDELNNLLTSSDFWNKKRFESSISDNDTLVPKLTKKNVLTTLKDDNLIAFNRVLLDKSYPAEVVKSPPDTTCPVDPG